jgi:hypothetical protein
MILCRLQAQNWTDMKSTRIGAGGMGEVGLWAQAGEADKPFALLEKGYQERDEGILRLKEPIFDPIKSDHGTRICFSALVCLRTSFGTVCARPNLPPHSMRAAGQLMWVFFNNSGKRGSVARSLCDQTNFLVSVWCLL